MLPSTAAGMYKISEAEASRRLKDPQFALDAGFRYLAHQKKTFGTWRLALAAYNAGPNAVREYGGVPPYQETQNYVRNIMGRVGSLTAAVDKGGVAAPSSGAPASAAPSAPSGPDLGALAVQNLQDLGRGKYNAQKALGDLAMTVASTPPPTPVAAPRSPVEASTTLPGDFSLSVEGKVDKRAQSAVTLAKSFIGTPYVWGGENPGGFDCSGLLQYVWKQKGVDIPRVTYDQWRAGKKIGKNNLRPGDAVFFRKGRRGPEHVGMYIGEGRFIEAPSRGKDIRISKLAGRSDLMGARRFGPPPRKR